MGEELTVVTSEGRKQRVGLWELFLITSLVETFDFSSDACITHIKNNDYKLQQK